MARIKGKDTEPELIVRRALRQAGLRYRLQLKTPGGKADLVVTTHKFALFIDGCFWHGCPEHYVHPRTNWPFWDGKLRENVDRDRRQTLALKAAGWRYLRVWEHEVREDPDRVVERITRCLEGGLRRKADWRVVLVDATASADGAEQRHHEDLLDAGKKMTTLRQRTTTKIGRVAAGLVRTMSAPRARSPRGGRHHGRKSGRDGEA